jgi:hypothetical protein
MAIAHLVVVTNPRKLKGLVVDGELHGGICVWHGICPADMRCDL